jgi:uncharacterized protein YukE
LTYVREDHGVIFPDVDEPDGPTSKVTVKSAVTARTGDPGPHHGGKRMSAQDLYIDPDELNKLSGAFQSYAHDLESALRSFMSKTGSEAIHDGFGVLTESEEVTSAYIELSENTSKSITNLHKHLDHIAQLIQSNAENSASADHAIATAFHGEAK